MISVKITKLEIEHSLKQRLDFICEFANVNPKYKCGSKTCKKMKRW